MITAQEIISGKVDVTESQAMKIMAEDTGIDINTPLGAKLWEKAWDDGHSAGLSEVCLIFQGFDEIWEAAKKTFQ